jgi:hypothetical protein
MSSKIEVSRELLERVTGTVSKSYDVEDVMRANSELRSLLATPVVERQTLTHSMKSVAEAVDASRCYTVLTSNQCFSLAQSLNNQAISVAPPELAELQADMAQKVILAVRDACELEPADGDDPECICIKASDLGLILSRHFEGIE